MTEILFGYDYTYKASIIVSLHSIAAMMQTETRWTLDTHDISLRISLALAPK